MRKKTAKAVVRHARLALYALAVSALCSLRPTPASAQLSSNADKFLGNITTSYNVDYGSEKFHTLWNQITPENESKWQSIEGSRRGSFNWSGCDRAYNYAKTHHFPFKFHTLIWGAQYPTWMNNLSSAEQYKAIEEWMDAIKQRYPDLPLIDVVNEAVAGHQPAPYKAALGGDGKTGYDWIIKAFEMAHERWPDAILIYNDYNTFRWQRTEFINLVRTLRDAGAPIDAYGCQSHDLTDMSLSDFKTAMTTIQSALQMPMYSTEYDIGTTDDALQLQRYQEQIPYMWEADYCAGITLWGYIYGRTWTTDGNSGIIRDGKDRPAMTWLREYMQSDAAKNAKSPFPGMVKEASVYVKPSTLSATKGEVLPITVRARLRTKTIDHVDLYVNNILVSTMTEAPYATEYTPKVLGKHNLRAVVTATDGTTYERLSSFTSYNPRTTFKGEIALPGTLEAENFDAGGDGVTFHDSDTRNEGGTSYRSNGGGVDIVQCTGGYAIGYTADGEWLEYTVDVKEAGLYSYDAYASSGVTTSSFNLTIDTAEGTQALTPTIAVPCVKASNWDTYTAIHGRLLLPLEAGKQVIRLNIIGGSCNIDKLVFKHIEVDNGIQIALTADPTPATVNTSTTLRATVSSPTSAISQVRFYANNVLLNTIDAAPFETSFLPVEKGNVAISAIATDADGKESAIAHYSLTVNNKRTAYRGIVSIPGTFEAENFDQGGEGFTFHDSDGNDEGSTNYRSDNEGVDIVQGNNGYVIGYTAANEWLEYTVDVKTAGEYTYEATVSSGSTNSGFSVSLVADGKTTQLFRVSVPQTASNSWDTYKVVTGKVARPLEQGQHVLRLTITGAYCNIDKIRLIAAPDGIDTVDVMAEAEAPLYNLMGVRVGSDYRGIVVRNGKKMLKTR